MQNFLPFRVVNIIIYNKNLFENGSEQNLTFYFFFFLHPGKLPVSDGVKVQHELNRLIPFQPLPFPLSLPSFDLIVSLSLLLTKGLIVIVGVR